MTDAALQLVEIVREAGGPGKIAAPEQLLALVAGLKTRS